MPVRDDLLNDLEKLIRAGATDKALEKCGRRCPT